MEQTIQLSIVSPVYKAEQIVEELVKQLLGQLVQITPHFEIILVNDGSPDDSWSRIIKVCREEKRVKGLNLSRNFGQHYAITAGLNYCQGEWVVVMDCDLQDRPEEIPRLFAKAMEGWDIVYARRIERQDNLFKRASSKFFHSLYSYLSEVKSDSATANFGIFNKKVITEFTLMKETARSFPSLIQFLGFSRTSIDVIHGERLAGKSSYTFSKLLHLTLDVVLSNSNKPLKLTVKLGFFISLFSFCLAVYNVIAHYLGVITVDGFTSTIFSIWFMGGLNLFVLGVVGLYVGRIFVQAKDRQLYIVSEKLNFEK